MRKQDKIVIWPVYFDSTKTRNDGRRVPKSLAVPSPKILEVKEAVEKLGLKFEIALEARHPKTPWMKTGVLFIEKDEPKEQMIERIANQLLKIRSASKSR
ncbi:MAG: signal recognition particle subunit SRP19/SEC65 family protein [Candidatus Bathyarchaeia archaeon]